MSMRVLLTVLDHYSVNETALETACRLSSGWACRLDVVLPYPQIWETELALLSDETDGIRIREMEVHLQAAEREIVDRQVGPFEACCRQFKIPIVATDAENRDPPFARWVPIKGGERGKETVTRARVADLIIMKRPDSGTGANYEELLSLLLREAGHPLLVAPPDVVKLEFGRLAVAWNGSAEAARAVSASMDLLAAAERVDLLTAESERTLGSVVDPMVRYLGSHGIEARPHAVTRHGLGSVGDAILEKCRELNTDLLVMGAYTHNRFRELIFGGVTRDVLRDADLPVLMAH